jgi:streptomycin 6-kinase
MTVQLELDRRALRALGFDESIIAERRCLDGGPAERFLAELPELVDQWQERLGLTGARLLPGGVLSAAFACQERGEAVVLKLSAAHATSARSEAAALRIWAGRGACRLRFASDDGRVMLLDAVRPGTPLVPVSESEDARRLARLMAALHRPLGVPGVIPDARAELDWRFSRAHQMLDGPSPARGAISHPEIVQAHHRALGLDAERPVTVLCHGDLLDKNILVDGWGEWWAIDPRPCRGDPCLDAAFWALAHRDGRDATSRAAVVAGAIGLDPGRIEAWMCSFAVSEAVLARSAGLSAAYLEFLGGRTRRSIR